MDGKEYSETEDTDLLGAEPVESDILDAEFLGLEQLGSESPDAESPEADDPETEEERIRSLSKLTILNEENVRQILSEVIWL